MSTEAGVWVDGTEVVELVLSWCDARSPQGISAGWSQRERNLTVLAVEQVKSGQRFALGERGDALVPEEVLGADRFEIVRHDGDTATALVPRGAKLRVDGWPREEKEVEIARGHVVEIELGAFVVRLARVRAERRPAGAPFEGLRSEGAGFIAGSALLHAAAFAVVAFFCPALGAAEEEPFDADRLAYLRHMIDATAQRELEQTPTETPEAAAGGSNPGSAARDAEGEAGKPDAANKDARWAARGTARPEDATLARERTLAEATSYGLLGMLPSSLGDPSAPTLTWGTVQNGSDDVDKIGHLFGGSIDDAMGTGGWGLSGPGEGGGGKAHAIGLGDVSALGHVGTCLGSGPCDGIGIGRGRPGGGYTSHFKGPRYGTPQTTGHLPAEVIQRIVRQNDGRYRFCYQNALKSNPTLQGRVTVKFVIDRQGAVALAADAGSDIPDEGVRKCVVSSFTNLSFPAPDSGMVTVVYPLVFNPE